MRDLLARSRGLAVAILLIFFFTPSLALAQAKAGSLWSDVDEAFLKSVTERDIVPRSYRTIALDMTALEALLASAPVESITDMTRIPGTDETVLSLPLPDGGFSRFHVIESPIMEPGLAAKFPNIKTYRGQGIDDPSASVRFDRTPVGFHAMILSPAGAVYIDPYSRRDTTHYISYWARDADLSDRTFECGVEGDTHAAEHIAHYRAKQGGGNGATLRTYRTAVAATGEYTIFHGGTVELGQAAIVTAMNRVNELYENDTAIRMVLVANNDLVVYTDPNTDPYTNNNGSVMLNQNQANLDAVIGSPNYDVGHVFSTGGGGIAQLRVPCTASKARGVTGLASPIGDPFWVDFVAHELGHQWGGNHSFNGDAGSCAGGNRNGSTAYEPGSGSTIQAYAGICGAQNLQPNSDPFFHGISLDEIIGYSTTGAGNGCAVQTATGNEPPTVDAGDAYIIPLDTPFELCGSGADPDGDPLTYGWEQFDRGPAGAPDMPVGDAPIFRAWPPTESPCRTFPRIGDLAAGTLVIGEILPTYARTMNFRLTGRDNRSGGGGVNDDATTVEVVDSGGPFQVATPNGGDSFPQGGQLSVAWDVANTDQAPINCATVDIFLSADGGLTYPSTLATGTANDGSESVTLPNEANFAARIQVRCASSIFFDISDADFGIGVPAVTITSPADESTFEEGETVTFTATAVDPEDGDLASDLEWTSSIDGLIGTGGSFDISSLSLGTHLITTSVADSDTNLVEDSITVNVQPVCLVSVELADYETDDGGWTDSAASTCTTGTFIRGTPDEVIDGGIITQPDGASTGDFAWFTQNNDGGVGTDDVDGGTCETLSPLINIGAGNDLTIFVDYFHGQRDPGDDEEDGFSIEILDGGGAVIATMIEIGDVSNNAIWDTIWTQIANAPASIQLRVRATDGTAGGDLVEAGIDNVQLCVGSVKVVPIFEDGFESGDFSAWDNVEP